MIAAVAIIVVGVVAVAAVVRSRSGDGAAAATEPSTTSSPFLVTEPPEGSRVVRVGVGTLPTTFGSDIESTIEPFTLLTADGTPDGADPVAVSYTLGADEWAIEVERRDGGSEPERLEIGGRVATFASGPDWSDLTLKRNADVWVRVSSGTLRSRDELVAIAEEVPVPAVEDRSTAPDVGAGIGGLLVAGSVDADVVAAQWPSAWVQGELAPAGAHVVVLGSDSTEEVRLTVRTLPGRSADLDVIGRHPWLDPRRIGVGDVDCRPSVHLTCDWCRASVTTTPWGDLLIASGPDDVDHAVLDAVLASVEQTDEAGWEQAAEAAFGGPDLQPDPGAEEVAGGSVDGVDWLLQTVPEGREPMSEGAVSTPDGGIEELGLEVEYGIDRCLKLSDLTRACGSTGGGRSTGGTSTSIVSFQTDDARRVGGSPLVTLVAVRGYPEEVVAVRAVGPAEPATDARPARDAFDLTVPLAPAPIGDGRYAVFEVPVGMALCTDPTPIAEQFEMAAPTWSRVSLVDADGDEIACLGIG